MCCGCWLIGALELLRSRGLPLQRVNIRGAYVRQHQRLIIWRPTSTSSEDPLRQPESRQAGQSLDLPVANPYSKKGSPSQRAVEVNVLPIPRPMRVTCVLVD